MHPWTGQSPPQDRIKHVGDFRLRLQQCAVLSDGVYVSVPWSWVWLTDLNGASIYAGLLRDDDITLEMLTQIENYRQYEKDCAAVNAG